ncbi:aldehyde dehydrogenase family protein [Gordonia amarae]|uniref:aldehyde dehydrogenase (NAD(+)) n=2 Tax=Gordonia amarae TaxID=36821 RepID=G7GUD3_9ACTN|nr:aldehyde dehydrogenase [Gordonia amarae]MCS3877446.1 acyl-CoA reductase-like NAD-dependent aldehyde dehydrogenase [Gordonia amarae]QHN16185.1 aldehyde dehydrogenase family protein [Gordonia amarae]QHN20753.1 aldehyde dehydrogenase family protein [Gordonia amarae]QHN29605.1 aldehyde dehydrogenase family protein [Gordonia amarae]QHN38381.1 aldehyde dehydrogenase family protein [Gordonia amarae]
MTETVEAATAAIPGAGDHNQLYLGGQWVDPHSAATLEVFSPATGVRVGSTPEADAADVDAAVKAARASFDSGVWSSVPPAERADVLDRAAALIEERSAEITALVSAEMGAPASAVATLQQLPGTGVLRAYAQAARDYAWVEYREGLFGVTRVTREPAGVVGAITAWNVPLFLVCNKFGAALAAGCSIVLKPAPETPLIANVLAEIMVEAGVPEGVISVVPGGAETGKALVDHPGVDKITFTGSTAAGKAIGASCAQNLKRCSLELGGKSAAIVLDDVDIAAHGYMLAFFGLFNTGQACVAQTRVLVPRSRQDEIVEAMVAAAKTMTVGTPDDPAAQLGPVISERQRQRIEGYIEAGKAAGATAVLDGGRPEGLDNGFFLNPTIFTGVTNDMVIAQEEIFGPVVSVIAYDTVDEAIAIANDSDYGLAGSVWTADVERGIEISEKIRTGTFGVNFYAIDPGSPFGGYKNSGIGRECGPEGLEAFIEHKSTMLPAGYQVPQSS